MTPDEFIAEITAANKSGMTKVELADILGVSATTVGVYIRGQSRPQPGPIARWEAYVPPPKPKRISASGSCRRCDLRNECMTGVVALRPTLCEMDKLKKASEALKNNQTKHTETRRRLVTLLAETPGYIPGPVIREALGLSPREFTNMIRTAAPWIETHGRPTDADSGYGVSRLFLEMLADG